MFWGRYVDWVIIMLLFLLDLFLLVGIDGVYIFMVVIVDVIMVLSGLFVL